MREEADVLERGLMRPAHAGKECPTLGKRSLKPLKGRILGGAIAVSACR